MAQAARTYTLTATSLPPNLQETASLSFSITVQPAPNAAPVADAGEDQAVPPGSFVQLDSTGSTGPEGDALTYAWSGASIFTFSDPNSATPTLTVSNSVSPSLDYNISQVVSAIHGATSSDTANIRILDDVPALAFAPGALIADQTYTIGQAITDLTLPEASGGTAPISYELSPVLPDGLAFEASTRIISGTPRQVRAAATYTWTATSGNETVTLDFDITVRAGVPLGVPTLTLSASTVTYTDTSADDSFDAFEFMATPRDPDEPLEGPGDNYVLRVESSTGLSLSTDAVVAGTYGSLSSNGLPFFQDFIDAGRSRAFTYTPDAEAIQALAAGETATDTFIIAFLLGDSSGQFFEMASATFTVTLVGANEAEPLTFAPDASIADQVGTRASTSRLNLQRTRHPSPTPD